MKKQQKIDETFLIQLRLTHHAKPVLIKRRRPLCLQADFSKIRNHEYLMPFPAAAEFVYQKPQLIFAGCNDRR